jgi:hypothetical protein
MDEALPEGIPGRVRPREGTPFHSPGEVLRVKPVENIYKY